MSLKVWQVAEMLQVSERRVRVLLAQGRLQGRKSDTGAWLCDYPLSITSGKRGPDINRYPTRFPFSKSRSESSNPSKGVRQGKDAPSPVKIAPDGSNGA